MWRYPILIILAIGTWRCHRRAARRAAANSPPDHCRVARTPPHAHLGAMSRRKKSHQSHGTANRPRFWGKHAVAAALDNPDRKVLRAWATRDAAALMQFPDDDPADVRGRRGPGRLVPHDAPHQGVVIEVEPLEDAWLDELLEPDDAERAVLLVLDQVTDPHNVGAILRSAAAFGAVGIVTQDRHSPPESGVVAKAASGALERVPWARVVNLARALEEIGEAGFWRIGLAGDADTDLKDALGPPRSRAGARRGRTWPEAQYARALRRAGAAADQQRGRKPQRLQRGRGRALRGEQQLMVRTRTSIRSSGRGARQPGAGVRRGARTPRRPRAAKQRARRADPAADHRRPAGQRRRRAIDVGQARGGVRRRRRTSPGFSPPATRSCARPACRGRRRGTSAASPSWSCPASSSSPGLPEDDEEAIALLTKIKGIGRWSAEIYLLFAEGRPDVFPGRRPGGA